jgi:hypothetical protein
VLTSIQRWIDRNGCPLIMYRNKPRDVYNIEMAKVFSTATGQEIVLPFNRYQRKGEKNDES